MFFSLCLQAKNETAHKSTACLLRAAKEFRENGQALVDGYIKKYHPEYPYVTYEVITAMATYSAVRDILNELLGGVDWLGTNEDFSNFMDDLAEDNIIPERFFYPSGYSRQQKRRREEPEESTGSH
jgi:hypothetical protein